MKIFKLQHCLFALFLFLGAGFLFEKWANKKELATLEKKGKLLDVNGSLMHIQCAGEGSPIVVLESGLGSDMTSWNKVFGPISTFTKVCRYDRSGYGLSASNSSKRKIEDQNEELKLLLREAGINGPKILVGHSAGGLYIRQFSKVDPEIVGMVLVDSSISLPKEEFERFFKSPIFASYLKLWEAKFSLIRIHDFFFPDPLLNNGRPEGYPIQNTSSSRYLEALTQDENIYVDLLQANETDLGDLPIVVISRGKDFMGQGSAKSEFDIAWNSWQKKLLDLSTHSQQVIAQNSGHMIQFDQPELVIETIRTIWEHSSRANQAKHFKKFVKVFGDEIVQSWINFFVYHKKIVTKKIAGKI